MTAARSVLHAQFLRVRFGGIEALGGVSVRCEAGRVVGVIGPNGAGKSTLFNAICGLVPVAQGQVEVEGHRLGTAPFGWRDALAVLALGVFALVLTINLDQLWQRSVVEPYRLRIMAERQGEAVVERASVVGDVYDALVAAPYVRAERQQFCVLSSTGEVQTCCSSLRDASAALETSRHRDAPRARARAGWLSLRGLGVIFLAFLFWRRRQRQVAWSPRALAQRGIARTFQNIRLFDDLSVADNVRVVSEQHERKTGATHSAQQVDACLARVGLSGKRDCMANELSYGERRRLEIARALALHPTTLLLDEPAAGLHAGETSELLSLVRALREEGMAILLIEHDMSLVMSVSDRVLVLDHGVCIAEGTPEDVREDPAVIAAYLGEGPSEPALRARVTTPC